MHRLITATCCQHQDLPSFPTRRSSDLITRGNSGNGVLLTRENRAAREQKSGSGKTRLGASHRSEEHTSELQSLTNLVCRLLLEKKKIPRTERRTRDKT